MIHDQTKFPFNSNFFLDRQAGLPIENEMDWDNHDGRSRPYQYTWTPLPNTNVGNNFIFSALRDGQLHAGHGIEPGDWIDLYRSSSVYPVKVISIEDNHQIRVNLNGVNGPFTGFKKRINPAILNEDFAQWSFPPFGIELSGKAPMPSYSRNSNATRGIGVGQIEVTPPNVLRMDYDLGAGEYLGALFEGQKTNVVNTKGWAASAGASVVSTSIDAPDGSLTATRISGILAANGDRSSSSIASVAGSTLYNSATWIRGEAGKVVGLYAKRSGAGAFSGTSTSFLVTLTGSWQQINIGSWTTASDNVAAAIFVINNNGTASADTLDLWQPQIETGGHSSTILTSGSAATRQGDTMVVNDMSWFNPAGGVFLAKVRAYPGTDSGFKSILRVGAADNNRLEMRICHQPTNNVPVGILGTGSTTSLYTAGTSPASQTQWEKLALAYSTTGGGHFGRITGSGTPVVTSNPNNYSGAIPASMAVGLVMDAHLGDYGIRYMPGQFNAADISNLLAAIP